MEAEDVKRIRAKLSAREGKTVTQAELARRLGTSRRNVENWEQDTRGIGEENAEKLRKLEKE
jgi:transcriptional regulator with XRE-family HTH domain